MDIRFYDYIGAILKLIGFQNAQITRQGEVNVRMDAIIVDNNNSIPIEIKSPRESIDINIKSIRQALENKIILLSRKFYPTAPDITSLSIAFEYPNSRSDVYELIEDIHKAFNYNIGMLNIEDLLKLVYDIQNNKKQINLEYFYKFKGKFDYEKAFI